MSYDEHMQMVAQRVDGLRERCAGLLASCGDELTLELGCGHGHYLASYASAYPAEFCLGIDLITKRIEKAQSKAQKRKLFNLHFLKADANELLAALPSRIRFARVFILFPDPWPKKRHFKNRLIQQRFLSELAERMTTGHKLFFRTDHEGYFAWAQEQLEQHADWEIMGDALWPHEADSYFQDLMTSWQSLIAQRR